MIYKLNPTLSHRQPQRQQVQPKRQQQRQQKYENKYNLFVGISAIITLWEVEWLPKYNI